MNNSFNNRDSHNRPEQNRVKYGTENGIVRKSTGELTKSEKKDAKFERVYTGIDRPLTVLVLLLLAIGSIMVFSASYVYAETKTGNSMYYIKRQILFAVCGIAIMFLSALYIKYTTYRKFNWVIYLFVVACLVAVLFIGKSQGEAQRWIPLPFGLTFQPSELMKFAVVFLLAGYFTVKDDLKKRSYSRCKVFLYDALIPFAMVGFSALLVMLEHHLSGTLIIGAIGIVVIIAGGGNLKYTAAFLGIGILAVVVFILLRGGYEMDRIQTWLHPEEHALDGAWQNIQGLYAIGSGGLLGVGLGNSRLKYNYVSMPHNDFIFTIVCEELGFVGAVVIIILFALLIWRGFVIAMRAPDKFSSLTAVGITSKVAIQTLLNIAVVTGTVPNTGVALPFFSYGGTATVILMFEMGVLLSISRHSYQKK